MSESQSNTTSIFPSLRDPGFWAARLVAAAVAADPRLEEDFLAALQRDGLSKSAAEDRMGLVYELAGLVENGATVTDAALAQKVEVMAAQYYGDDDILVDGGSLIRKSGEDGFWVQADVYVPNQNAPADEG